ncbi:MAG TPA: AMP-binding protein [Actinomycetota bacterium]|nr:AMP-binding protein [Actinomycetota bacterium]
MTDIIWSPTDEYVERANVTRFMRTHGIETYEDLVHRSIADTEWFWDAVVRDLDIEFLEPYRQVRDVSRGVEWATWFGGGRVNLAHQCVDRWAARTPEASAVVWEGEGGETRTWTYAELRRQTDRLARGLERLGVGSGDAVAIFMPMMPETVAAVMACSKIGAIWVPIFSGFGVDAVAARLNDANVKVVLTADAFLRKGRAVPMSETARLARGRATTVGATVVLAHAGEGATGDEHDWTELISRESVEPLEAERLDPEHPLFIGYTSGTTGKPKGVLHVHGGFLVKIAAEVAYQVDARPGDVVHWVTDLGWIMGPWEIVGALALGSTVLLYDGAPTHPGPDRLWSMVERHRITALGVSPTLIRALIPAGAERIRRHDLSSLRILASTGEPWNPDAYLWLYREVGGSRLPIVNLSGGTEVGACFLSPLPICDLKPCTLRGPALGMDVDIVDATGMPVGPGEVGELVCRQPWPSMTRGIWGDPDRYLDTYWRRFPGIWVHGDWATRDADGFWFLHGRSDDTLSVAGKRLGPAEVESALASHPAVAESAAIGVPHSLKGEAIWCFVVLKPGVDPDPGLSTKLRNVVADHLGRSFLPSKVVFVPELPKTRSAKIVRRAIRATALSEDPGDLSSIEDPGSLDGIRRALDLKP